MPRAGPEQPTVGELSSVIYLRSISFSGVTLVAWSTKEEQQELTSAQPTVRVNAGPIGSVTIKYNGLDFLISNFAGYVSVNGIPATINGVLPGSCVITIGADLLGSGRQHLTFDVSHPEVVI